MLAILAFAACGAHRTRSGGFPLVSDGGLQSTDSALAELNALLCPEGVDSNLWSELRDALEEALISKEESRLSSRDLELEESRFENRDSSSDTARSASVPPTGNDNKVADLAVADNGDGTYTLTWRYRNLGDYDQDGKVGISDITPIAQHFGETWSEGEENTLAAVIDGSGNGVVDIADVTQIAMCFGVNLHHYTVQGAHLFNGPFVDVAEVVLPEGAQTARVEFPHDLGEPPYLNWRVVPYDSEGNAGPASNVVVVSEAPPPAVRILSINPLGGVTGAEAIFTATVTGDPPLTSSWDFGGGASPNESAEPSPTVMLGGVNTYQASLTVENAQGSASRNFTLTVTEVPGEPPEIISVSSTEGDSGTEATFSAEVTGDGLLEYYWNFGGGASPNQSAASSPTVTLSRGGTLPEPVRTYPASLTVTNPSGTDVLDFDLDVSAWWHVHEMDHLPQDISTSWAFAIAPDGTPAIAVRRAAGTEFSPPYEVYYCRWENGGWREELVDGYIRGSKLALAFDPQDRPGILLGGGLAYGRQGNKYLHYDGSAWSREDFDDTTIVSSLGLAYYPNGTPLAIYSTSAIIGADLMVATRKGQGWELENLVEEGEVSGSSFALGDDGTIHIRYTWHTTDDWGAKYATNAGGGWAHEWIEHDTTGTRMILDSESRPATSYLVDYTGTFFTTKTETGWQPEMIDALTSSSGIPIIDSAGIPILFRYNSSEDELLISYRGSGGWITQPFGPEGSTVSGFGDALLTPEGDPAALYTYKTGETSQLALDTYW